MYGYNNDIICTEMFAYIVYSPAPRTKDYIILFGYELLCVVAHCFEPFDYFCCYLTAVLIFSKPSVGGTLACGVYAVSWVCEYYHNICSFLFF